MTAPGSMWDKLPKVGKAVGHALGGGRYVDAIDALSGVNDPDVQSFVARAERSLADNGTAWSAIPEVDRDAAADVLTEVLDSLLPTDVWGDALLSASHVREHVMASGGAAALDRFAVRDISTDTSITEPGRVLQSGAATPAGRAFTMLLEVACDALHMRAIAASDVDVAVLIGGLRKIAAGQIDAEDRLSAKLSRIDGLLAELSQTTGRHPRRGLIRVGEDAWPREAEAFVVRPELDTIRETLARESTVTVCQLNGMRGVGKSQLAAAYARECDAAGYEVVAWIDARSRESVIANMSRLVAEYAPGDPDENPETGIKRLLDRFGSAPDEHRLIVFDNVERFADLDGVLPSDLETKVITTTILTTGVLGPRVPVEVFTELVAADYLETRTQLADPEGARRVSQKVGCLALALAQAASTITARGYSYDRFLSALIARPIRDNLLREEGSDYRLGAAQAIDLAIETVVTAVGDEGKTQDDSLCTKTEAVFDALVLLANTGVPIEWLRALGDEFRIDEAVARLVGSSLAEYSEDKTSVRLHRLTRRVYAEERIVEETTRDRARQAALAALATGLPDEDEGTYEARRAALAHWLPYLATLLTDLSPVLAGPHFVSVAQRGVYLGNGHHLPYAVIACAALPDEVTRVLGPDHPNTLASRNNLAIALWTNGDRASALRQMQRAAERAVQVLSGTHPLATHLTKQADEMRRMMSDDPK